MRDLSPLFDPRMRCGLLHSLAHCSAVFPSLLPDFSTQLACTSLTMPSGGIDRKQRRAEFQGVRRNARERHDIEKEQWGTQRNPYWPLNGPSFSSRHNSVSLLFVAAALSARRLRFKFRGAGGKPTTEITYESRQLNRTRFARGLETLRLFHLSHWAPRRATLGRELPSNRT